MQLLGDIFQLPTYPLRFDYLPAWAVLAIFLLLAIPVIRFGKQTIRWQGPARGWTSIGVRLAAVWVLVLLLAGTRWERRHRDVETIVLRDVSASTASVPHARGITLGDVEYDYLKTVVAQRRSRDRIGVVSFDENARIDSLPAYHLRARAGGIGGRDDATNIAAAVQLGLACFRGDAMRRLVLISDGNPTQGETDAAIAAAISAGVTVDVMPLHYHIENEVMLERLIAPAQRRENEPMPLEVVLRSTSDHPIFGRLTVTDCGIGVDLDAKTPGVQSSVAVRLGSGSNHIRLGVPALSAGVHRFAATVEANDASADTITANNSAEAITFVRGRTRVLYIECVGGADAALLSNALRDAGTSVDTIDATQIDRVPRDVSELQGYDAIVLANVPRGGADGLDPQQERAIIRYVRDLGGGLIVVGGPQALGLGQWQGSQLETILPVNVEPSPRVVSTPGALVIVLDHSGSMEDPISSGGTKQQAVNRAAERAISSLSRQDQVGVIAFDTQPQWIVPLARNLNPAEASRLIRVIKPAGGTSIYPALERAVDALMQSSPRCVRHILLMTDGVSEPRDYEPLLMKMRAARITLSTVAVGNDADCPLLYRLARRGGGLSYGVNDSQRLCDVFIREAQTLHRPLMLEPAGGLPLAAVDPTFNDGTAFPRLAGIALTSPKTDSRVHVLLQAATPDRDAVLTRWQCGLGRAAVFAGDATNHWAHDWIASTIFAQFWPQVVRSVARNPASGGYDVWMVRQGTRTKLLVEADGIEGRAANFLTFRGKFTTPDAKAAATDIRLAQTGPGTYEAMLDTPAAGIYLASLAVDGPSGSAGTLTAAVVVNSSIELRDLHSNDLLLRQVAAQTGGRVLATFDPSADLFTREGLRRTSSSQPISDLLLVTLMSIVLFDVAVRRVACDWQRIKHVAAWSAAQARAFFATPSAQSVATLATLRNVRRGVADRRSKHIAPPAPRFDQPIAEFPPPPPPQTFGQSAGERRGYAVSLMAAKQRAREQIHQIGQNR